MFKNLGLDKLICPVCRGILIEPVTLPCKHDLCLECFNGSMEMANLTCPLCRKRVGAWLRREKKEGSLVNAKLWQYIQDNFADYVAVKQKGEDDGLQDELEGSACVKISEPGEIRKEFECSQAQLDKEMRAKQEIEEKASAELIQKLQVEEERCKKREEEDERLARQLQTQIEKEMNQESASKATESKETGETKTENKENKTLSAVRGPLDVFFSKVKPLQGNSRSNSPQTSVEEKEGQKVPRCDSITSEFPHFEFAPIHRVPQTPPKLSPDGAVLQVPLIRSTPVKHLQFEETPACSPPLVRQLSTLHFDKRDATSPSIPFNSHSSFSAFRGYQPKAVKRELAVGGSLIHSKMRRMDEDEYDSGAVSPDPFASDEDDDAQQSNSYSKYLSTLEQERQDALLAKQLQQQLDNEVAVSKSYQLRSKKKCQRKQPTLRETLRRAANKSTR